MKKSSANSLIRLKSTNRTVIKTSQTFRAFFRVDLRESAANLCDSIVFTFFYGRIAVRGLLLSFSRYISMFDINKAILQTVDL